MRHARDRVVASAARLVSDRYRRPVAAWLVAPSGGHVELVEACRLRSRREAEALEHMRLCPWGEATAHAKRAARRRFAEAADVRTTRVVRADPALLFIGDPPPELERSLPLVGEMVDVALRQVDGVEADRDGELELGLAWTAHEVRNPLLVARMALDRLAGGRDDPETASILLSRVRGELDELASLVEALLTTAARRDSMEREAVEVREVLQKAVGAGSVDPGRVRVSAPEGLMVEANSEHLLSAVSNLVRNALAYSPRDSEVVVEARRRNGVARISVSDQGPGIPSGERDAIFDPFVRGMSGRTRPGGGLGLFIARRTVEAHGGAIWVESDDRGATFHMELPRFRTGGNQSSAS